jgi:hypothetical protein
MGFLDEVKAAAIDLKDTVEGSLSSTNAARDVERMYRDLGMLTFLQDTGRAIDVADRERLLNGLKAAEAAGSIAAFTLVTGPPPPPPSASGPTVTD